MFRTDIRGHEAPHHHHVQIIYIYTHIHAYIHIYMLIHKCTYATVSSICCKWFAYNDGRKGHTRTHTHTTLYMIIIEKVMDAAMHQSSV